MNEGTVSFNHAKITKHEFYRQATFQMLLKKIKCSGCMNRYSIIFTGFLLGFPTGRDSATFWDSGTGKKFLSRDKGTTGQPQNLTTGRDGPGQPKFGTGQAGTTKIRDGTRDKTGQSRKGCSKTV